MRVALVTGSAQGIGLAISKSLLAKGFKVFGVDVKDQNVQIDSDGKEFYNPLRFDLSDAEQCRQLVKEIGRIDVLVNNAAILIESELDDVTDDQFDEIVSTNLRAPLFFL